MRLLSTLLAFFSIATTWFLCLLAKWLLFVHFVVIWCARTCMLVHCEKWARARARAYSVSKACIATHIPTLSNTWKSLNERQFSLLNNKKKCIQCELRSDANGRNKKKQQQIVLADKICLIQWKRNHMESEDEKRRLHLSEERWHFSKMNYSPNQWKWSGIFWRKRNVRQNKCHNCQNWKS